MRFLSRMNPGCNISQFRYRNQGADYGRVLVGIHVPKHHMTAFTEIIVALGYRCVDETTKPAHERLLR